MKLRYSNKDIAPKIILLIKMGVLESLFMQTYKFIKLCGKRFVYNRLYLVVVRIDKTSL